MRCRNGCGVDVIWSDQHLMGTPDGDAWLCSEPRPTALMGKDKRMGMDDKTRQAIEADKLLIGRGFARLRGDGSIEHIPAVDMLIFSGEVDPSALSEHLAELLKQFNRHTFTSGLPGPSGPPASITPEQLERIKNLPKHGGVIVDSLTVDDIIRALATILQFPDDQAVTLDELKTALKALMNIPHAMWLTCPRCNQQHIDEGEFRHKPHHTHACQNPKCGLVWRPMIASTVGVQTLPGFLNEPKRNPFDPGDGVLEQTSYPNDDGSFTVVRITHHKGCAGPRSCACEPIKTSDRHTKRD